ncbi:MAG: aminotransferase class I/II-fold pyridoxal phosphate-dependent enzyme [Gemmataceae bacterium]|nr:aminotransferase class I/II-fold pyridoxal phosphate-dependent enzyme [Gemmataceae bacterium]
MSYGKKHRDPQEWIAEAMGQFESSGIRKVFDLARKLKDPGNLSIGQPDFPVPEVVRKAAIGAIDRGQNSYTVTQGLPELREGILARARASLPADCFTDRSILMTSGTTGALVLALNCVLNPGDEVLGFDPWFVMYPNLVALDGTRFIAVDTAPSFVPDPERVRALITPRTKVMIINSPANPTGAMWPEEVLRALAELCLEKGILLISDEIYSMFSYDGPFISPARFNPQTLVIDGFSKSHAMTGWRVGYAHGPTRLIEEMIKLQQFTFVCAPSMAQHGAIAALEVDMSAEVASYKERRDFIRGELARDYDIGQPGGAFYLYVRAPHGRNGTEFVAEAINRNLLIIPGKVFSHHDTHFRISYAATMRTLERGVEILKDMAKG